MVQSATTYTLGARIAHLLDSTAAMARRAHPLLVIGVAAGFGYLATPLLLGPVSALSDAIHGRPTGIAPGGHLASGGNGTGAAPSTPAPATSPSVSVPNPATDPAASWAGWLPPRPSAPLPQPVMRARPQYAPDFGQRLFTRRQARAAAAQAYRQSVRPFYGPRRNSFGNRRTLIRPIGGGFNRIGGGGRIFGGGFRGGGWRR